MKSIRLSRHCSFRLRCPPPHCQTSYSSAKLRATPAGIAAVTAALRASSKPALQLRPDPLMRIAAKRPVPLQIREQRCLSSTVLMRTIAADLWKWSGTESCMWHRRSVAVETILLLPSGYFQLWEKRAELIGRSGQWQTGPTIYSSGVLSSYLYDVLQKNLTYL
jgi:hypothetical protein